MRHVGECVQHGAIVGRIGQHGDKGMVLGRGPATVRASAKNHAFVTVRTDPSDYGAVLDELAAHAGHVPYALRQELAAKGVARNAAFDVAGSYSYFRFPETIQIL